MRDLRAALKAAAEAMDLVREGLAVPSSDAIVVSAESILRHAAREARAAVEPTCCELACYEDPGCACDGCTPGLSEAWARAEAALPEGWRLHLTRRPEGSVIATASNRDGDSATSYAQPTPTDALLSLAARVVKP